MIKKLVIAAAALVVGLFILRVTTVGSLLTVWVKDASHFVGNQITPETRLKQLRLEVEKIDNDIKKAVDKLVDVELSKEELEKDVKGLRVKHEKSKKEMRALVDGLEQGNTLVGLGVSPEDAQSQLDLVRSEYESQKETLKIKEGLLQNKREKLTRANQLIKSMKANKEELVAQVEKMDAQLERLRIKQQDTNIEVDDSQVGKCKTLANDLRRRLAAEERRIEKYEEFNIGSSNGAAPAKASTSREESIRQAKRLLADDVVGK